MPSYFVAYALLLQEQSYTSRDWAAWHNTELLNTLTPKGIVFSFLFFSTQAGRKSAVLFLSKCLSIAFMFTDMGVGAAQGGASPSNPR